MLQKLQKKERSASDVCQEFIAESRIEIFVVVFLKYSDDIAEEDDGYRVHRYVPSNYIHYRITSCICTEFVACHVDPKDLEWVKSY